MAKSTIAIIGANEQKGAGVAKNLCHSNHRLLLFGHDNSSLTLLAAEIKNLDAHTDIDILDCLVDASWEADIIIIAVAVVDLKQIAGKMRDVATQKTIIFISDPCREISKLADSNSVDEEIQNLLPESKIIRVSNTRIAADVACALAEGRSIDWRSRSPIKISNY